MDIVRVMLLHVLARDNLHVLVILLLHVVTIMVIVDAINLGVIL